VGESGRWEERIGRRKAGRRPTGLGGSHGGGADFAHMDWEALRESGE
jgi:hypothetical protein